MGLSDASRSGGRLEITSVTRPVRVRSTQRELVAGSAELDITPPPGLPKAGHSANANTGRGFRTRLYVRCTYLSCAGTSLALVHSDLLSGSSLLTHLVAERIAAHTDIDREHLVIAGCHTHASGGGFFGTEFYNRFASNKAGLDPVWLEFLVDRISTAVIQAYEHRAPSRLAAGQINVAGITRNRSLPAHQREAAATGRTVPSDVFEAVDRRLTVLRVDRVADSGGLEPLTCLVSFGVHPTSVSVSGDDYNADIWGPLVTATRRLIARRSSTVPTVAGLLGTHADAAPDIQNQRLLHWDAIRLGAAAAEAAVNCWESLEGDLAKPEAASPLLGVVSDVVDFSSRSAAFQQLASPAIGASLVAGAYENATPVLVHVPPFRPNTPKPMSRGPQGAKWVLGGPFQRLIAPRRDFPRLMPFHLLQIGDLALFASPFEVTVGAGARLEGAIRQGFPRAKRSDPGSGVRFVCVLSLVGEYAGYLTTPAEYSRQFYEGGHTLYGPNSLTAVTATATSLVRRLTSQSSASSRRSHEAQEQAGRDGRTWRLSARNYHPGLPAGPEVVTAVGVPVFGRNKRGEACLTVAWQGPKAGAMSWNRPLAWVERQGVDGRWTRFEHGGHPVDDQGWSMWVGDHTATEIEDFDLGESAARAGESTSGVYVARWFVDPEELHADQPYRMVIANHHVPGSLASIGVTMSGQRSGR